MAHNSDDLSWGRLLLQIPELNGGPPQDRRFEHIEDPDFNVSAFTEDFVIRLMRDVRAERAKYPSEYERPQPGEVLLDEPTIKEMEPIVRKFGIGALIVNDCCPHDDDQNPPTAHVDEDFNTNIVRTDPLPPRSQAEQVPVLTRYDEGIENVTLCHHHARTRCACVMPRRRITTEAFLRRAPILENPEPPLEWHDTPRYNMHLFCALVWQGKLDTPLRLCHHPAFKWWTWQIPQGTHNCPAFDGFKTWIHLTLEAYLGLNMLLHGQATSTLRIATTDDYRNTYYYQAMLEDTTGDIRPQEIEKPWHRLFFGVGSAGPFGKWDQTGTHVTHQLLHGMEGGPEFEPLERRYVFQRTEQDVWDIMRTLASFRLPNEIILDIFKLADCQPTTKFRVLNDPLHEQNREALQKHLDKCWALFVGFEVMAQEMTPIDPHRYSSRLGWAGHIDSVVRRLQGSGDQARLHQRMISKWHRRTRGINETDMESVSS